MAYKKTSLKKSQRAFRLTPRLVILTVIITVTVIVGGFILFAVFNKPENLIKAKVDRLAKEYYENSFYENLINSSRYSGNPETALKKYTETGMEPISLQQLILVDSAKNADDATYLNQYCDDIATTIQFYPESPYSRDSYHTEVTYSCNF